MLSVNTNLAALNAQRNLDVSQSMLSRSMQRLSSGQRINGASDDAAGLAIATRLNAQVRGVNQAIRNANDGVAMLQTAEGGLGEVTNILTRIKELAVQSANSSNSTTDRTSLDSEVQALISEVTRIAVQTKFGATALLDGSFNGSFQVGTQSGQTISQTISNFKASALSGNVASQSDTYGADVSNVGVVNANTYVGLNSATALQITGPSGATFIRQTTSSDDTASFIQGSASAIATAKAINDSTSATGVTATATAATFTGTDASQFANNINIDGSTNKVTINGQSVIVNLNGGSVSARRTQFINAVNAQVSGVTASTTGTAGIVLTATDGRNISASATGNAANTAGGETFGFTTLVASEAVLARGGVTLQAGGTLTSTYANAAQVTGAGTSSAIANALSTLSVTSVSNANTAMFVVDALLDTVSSARGSLGAVQNRLASTVSNLGSVAQNLTDAKSRIMDADFATETANMTKAQILQQAGMSVLAQANAHPQLVLKLLQ